MYCVCQSAEEHHGGRCLRDDGEINKWPEIVPAAAAPYPAQPLGRMYTCGCQTYEDHFALKLCRH